MVDDVKFNKYVEAMVDIHQIHASDTMRDRRASGEVAQIPDCALLDIPTVTNSDAESCVRFVRPMIVSLWRYSQETLLMSIKYTTSVMVVFLIEMYHLCIGANNVL
ncbi:hypothetical protein LOK49_LG12G00243 [Camellia lanceoleosa]|uniref:Uncharacterized protein n=1 Tax=Camellia lanceoleosa TaxID=1840588 RepID=A0ACC0FUZ0_9ERIC|nr:hypothetical protein LOK49_LG12G00243 [Camellia lanceoleosa]